MSMFVKVYTDLRDFKEWSGASYWKRQMLQADNGERFEDWINDIYPEGIGEVELNDILWFSDEEICELYGWDYNHWMETSQLKGVGDNE